MSETNNFIKHKRTRNDNEEISELNIPHKSLVTKDHKLEIDISSSIRSDKKFIMDEQGRIIDEKGNLIQIKPESHSTLMINKNKQKELKVKELLKTNKGENLKYINKSNLKFYDPNLDISKKRRDKQMMMSFNFAEQGSYIKSAEEIRKKQQSELAQIDTNSISNQVDENKKINEINKDLLNIKPSLTRQRLRLKAIDLIPEVEWWDAYFLPPNKTSFSPYMAKDSNGILINSAPDEIRREAFTVTDNDFNINKTTIYIQHPVILRNDQIDKKNNIIMPEFLTVKEKKRMRRLKRLNKEKEKQERIKLGLMKPEKPKLKFNNFMSLLSNEAIQDPSQVEKMVRKAYEDRYKKMMIENEERKLTKEQKKEKLQKKFERDSKKETRACLFRVDDLNFNKNRFKIDKNAQQLYLTGLCLMKRRKSKFEFANLVYVEGGPNSIKKFQNLMIRRIKWDNENVKDENNEKSDQSNKKCYLVWEGTLKRRYFDKWKMTEIKTEEDAKKILDEKGIDHFWNLVNSYQIDNN